MRLYMFEHCSLCFRVPMTAALKRVHLQETVVLDDAITTSTRTSLRCYNASRVNRLIRY
jgi:glutaredoxin 2